MLAFNFRIRSCFIIKFLKRLFKKPKADLAVTVIPRDQHTVAQENISRNALKVLNRLHESGWEAYLVGGGVRDVLAGFNPKDFDVATNATPETVRRLFRNSRLIGKRFRLVHVYFGMDIVEVATFRALANNDHQQQYSETGMLLRDNIYGTIQEDAWRRDFTVNALYYNIADASIVDFTHGMTDLKKRSIRMIGNAVERYREDPVRMLRAIRLAAKLDFTIEQETANAIYPLRELLLQVSSARLFDEMVKLFYCGKSVQAFNLLQHYQLLDILFPDIKFAFDGEHQAMVEKFIQAALRNTDQRLQQNLSLNPAFLLAVLLWWPMQVLLEENKKTMRMFSALDAAIHQILRQQVTRIAIPKRFTSMVREIWLLQFQLQQRRGKRAYRNFFHPRFRAAYDFLVLRAEAGENVQALCEWWGQFQAGDEEQQALMIRELNQSQPRTRKKKKKKKSPSAPTSNPAAPTSDS